MSEDKIEDADVTDIEDKPLPKSEDKLKKWPSTPTLVIIGIIIFGTIIFTLYQAYTTKDTPQQFSDANFNMGIFVECLNNQHAMLFTYEGCPVCEQQKNMFIENTAEGQIKHYENLALIDCSLGNNKAQCEVMNISAVPTWAINGNMYLGLQDLFTLSNISGCPVYNEA